jgi:hypothetical protein
VRTRRVGEDAGLAAAEAHRVGLATPVDLDVQPRGQGVDDGRADAVQATGGGVRTAAELAARVQLGEDHLDAGEPGAGSMSTGMPRPLSRTSTSRRRAG